MAQQLDHIEYMSKEIGPRPAGTEEEQQAALYIADTFQNEAGFPALVEDIVSSSNVKSPRAICSIATVVVCLIVLFFHGFLLPAFFIALIAGALYAAESMGYTFLTKTLSHGASQNVVAKYEPSSQTSKRSRKIILVAHYDTGKVKPKLVSLLDSLPVPWDLVSFVGMLFIPFFLLLKLLFFADPQGAAAVITNLILIIAMIAAALPAVRAILYQLAPFSEGANDNASGVSIMLEVAKTISAGLMNEDEIEEQSENVVVHGADEAYENDLVPDGAEIVYRAEVSAEEQVEPQSAEERLASAKAAIAALTGAPVSTTAYVSAERDVTRSETRENQAPVEEESFDDAYVSEDVASSENQMAEAVETEVAPVSAEASAESEGIPVEDDNAPVDVPRETSTVCAGQTLVSQQAEDSNLPDWYVEAQRKAKRSSSKVKYAQRSRYADALDAAVSTSSSYFDEANRIVETESAERMRARSADIVEVLPPVPGERNDTPAAGSPKGQSIGSWDTITTADYTTPEAEAAVAAANDVASQRAAEAQIAGLEPNNNPALDTPATSGATTSMAPIAFTSEELEAFGASTQAVSAAASQDANARNAKSAGIPSIDLSMSSEDPDFVSMGQRAPLADAVDKSGAKSRLTMLPAIDLANPSSAAQDSPSRSGAMRSLRSNLPSFSGSLERIEGDEETATPSVSSVGSFGASGATGSFEPVGEELLEDVDPEEIYVDDADDSELDDRYTESGAYAGPGYMDMPKSRVRRFFNKFHFGSKKNEELEESPQEWLEVEDEFDPREVGKERGGWESFRDESVRNRRGGSENRGYEDDYESDYADDYYDGNADGEQSVYVDDYYDEQEPPAPRGGGSRGWEGGGLSRVRLGHVDTTSRSEDDEPQDMEINLGDPELSGEMKQIYTFRNPDFATEVWFVALGSEVEAHDGMKAFIEEHRADLRGAIFIDLEALGAGELSLVESEGMLLQKRSSSRMKRYLQKASRATGISFNTINMPGNESAASTAIAAGLQALHLVGADANSKALTAADEDILDNIDQETLEANTYFVEELIKSI